MVQDILNEIYYMISDMVEPYKYLETWVLLERKTQRAAIISDDMYDLIPAQSVFKVNSLWKVIYLKKPLIYEESHHEMEGDFLQKELINVSGKLRESSDE